MVAHFLQSVTQRLVLGGELVYHRRPGEEGAILTLAGKYSGTEPTETVVRGSDSGLFWGSLPLSTAVTVFFPSVFLPPAVHWVATLNVGSGGAHASYYHRANEQVRLLT